MASHPATKNFVEIASNDISAAMDDYNEYLESLKSSPAHITNVLVEPLSDSFLKNERDLRIQIELVGRSIRKLSTPKNSNKLPEFMDAEFKIKRHIYL